jgi:hypothetical protein
MLVGAEMRAKQLARRLGAAALFAAILAFARPDRADEAVVPPGVQAELLVKVAAYDRNFAARAGARAQILVVSKAGDDDSARVAAALIKALGAQPTIAGLPHDEALLRFADAPALAATTRTKHAAVVYLASGFADAEVAAIAGALEGVDVLSVASVAAYVPRGAVLGFDLVSGKPKLLVHLGQARKQKVAFGAEILKLMQVHE